MLDAHRRLDGVLDRHSGTPQIVEPSWLDRNPDGLGVDDGVERAAKGHVGVQRATVEPQRHARMQDERRHVAKADARDATRLAVARDGRAGGDLSGRRIEDDLAGSAWRDQSTFERDRRHRDDAVPAHRAIAFVVHEEDAGVGAVALGFGEQRTVHVRVPSRLQHQCGSQVVVVLPHPLALLEHGLTFD